MTCSRYLLAALTAVAAVAAQSCFTGIESTPRISADDAAARTAPVPPASAEAAFMEGVQPQAPAAWEPGKAFTVADGRIGRIFVPAEPDDSTRVGGVLYFKAFEAANTLSGLDATDVLFADASGAVHRYRLPSVALAAVDTLAQLDVPFAVDNELVGAIDSRLRGRRLYTRTPQWYSPDGDRHAIAGLRYVAVDVDSVVAGDQYFPAAVCFHTVADSRPGMMLMSVGNGRADTRTFERLFFLGDPRRQYPEIKDEIWSLIVRSRVREGMTRQECRLALGQPDDVLRIPTYGGMSERWTYNDGIYLVFDDGYLTAYRL